MSDELVRQTVARAVAKAYDQWAAEHPSLATVIDRITLTANVVQSLRDSDEYRQAVTAYHRGMSELDLLDRLVELAAPMLATILTA